MALTPSSHPATTSSTEVSLPPLVAGPNPAISLRLAWGVLLVCSAALLGVAAGLEPDPAGLGTHQKLGLPACGWITAARLPCPTCGMTTAFSLTVRGHWLSAFRAQPAGSLLAWGCGIAFWVALLGVWGGAGLGVLVGPLLRWPTAVILALVVAAAWLYKVAMIRGF